MRQNCHTKLFAGLLVMLGLSALNSGCQHLQGPQNDVYVDQAPAGLDSRAQLHIGKDNDVAQGKTQSYEKVDLTPASLATTSNSWKSNPGADYESTVMKLGSDKVTGKPALDGEKVSRGSLVVQASTRETKTSVSKAAYADAAGPETANPLAAGSASTPFVQKPCCDGGNPAMHAGGFPRELDKVSLPDYIIEPPDILVIDTIRGIPLAPYRLEPGDILQIQVSETLPNEPIAGVFVIEPEGTINLGISYGAVRVAGLTMEQVRTAIENHLKRVLKTPRVVVALAQSRAMQQVVSGQHLVRPDGTVGLGAYGGVYIAGMNLYQAKMAIERHLSSFLSKPIISIDVVGYNTKVYYVIFDGGGYGQQIYRLPITGNETVLDAISEVRGLPAVSGKNRIWIARPAPPCLGCSQILPVNWNAITQAGETATNYQILPGDRIFVHADCLISLDNWLAKALSPIERLLGVTLLGSETVNSIRSRNGNNNTGFIGIVP